MRIALVIPHFFMNDDILPDVIFAPGKLAIELANGLVDLGNEVTLFTFGKVKSKAKNISGDLTYIDSELKLRGYDYKELMKNHPMSFVTQIRPVQSEIIAKAYEMANNDEFDIVHIYANEEEIALPFSKLCKKPVVFTHHEPFNFLAKYRSTFPKYRDLNWISISLAQRRSMPKDTNWVANIYHGLDEKLFKPKYEQGEYLAYFGRIIKPKGVEYAIETARKLGMKLKIAGKHYSDISNDSYWEKEILPLIDGQDIEYVGFIGGNKEKNEFLANALVLLVPSTWEEPFGMVAIESMACGTPVVGFNNGALTEIVHEDVNGNLAKFDKENTEKSIDNLVNAAKKALKIDRKLVRKYFDENFTSKRMCIEYQECYEKVLKNN